MLDTKSRVSVSKSDINTLLFYHDQQFVELAYQLLLGRQPDPDGLAHHLHSLRSGISRREVAYRIGISDEAQEKGVDRRLFSSYYKWQRVERIPVLGALLLIVVLLFRIRHFAREFRRIQNTVFGSLSVTLRTPS